MTVLVVSHLLGPEHGAGVARRTVTVARALVEHGARVQVLGTDAGISDAERAALSDLDVTFARCGSSRFPLPLLSPARLSRLVARADVALLFNHWSALNALVYAAARHHGVPHIVCPCGALRIDDGRSRTIKRVYNALAGRALVREARGWVATTRLESREFVPYGVEAERIAVIPNAVTLETSTDAAADPAADPAALREALGLGEAPFVLFVGRLSHIKGPDLLLEAFARAAPIVPTLQLVFAGRDEGLGAGLAARAAALGLTSRVRFAGFLHGARKQAAYRAATLLAVPSRREAMSLVALEAGAMGPPVLITDTCGFEDVRESGARNGDVACIVPATIDGLADGLRALLANASDLPRRGARLRQRVVEAHGWERVGARWMDLVTRGAEGARA